MRSVSEQIEVYRLAYPLVDGTYGSPTERCMFQAVGATCEAHMSDFNAPLVQMNVISFLLLLSSDCMAVDTYQFACYTAWSHGKPVKCARLWRLPSAAWTKAMASSALRAPNNRLRTRSGRTPQVLDEGRIAVRQLLDLSSSAAPMKTGSGNGINEERPRDTTAENSLHTTVHF